VRRRVPAGGSSSHHRSAGFQTTTNCFIIDHQCSNPAIWGWAPGIKVR
jgi:hypothetical protein